MLKLPSVVGVVGFLSGLWGAPASAQAIDAAHAATSSGPGLLAPYMPVIVAAVMGGGTAFAAWFIKTIIGMTIEAFCTFGETWADAKLLAAIASKDPSDDVPAMAFTKAIRAVCTKLRAAEKKIPGHEKDKE